MIRNGTYTVFGIEYFDYVFALHRPLPGYDKRNSRHPVHPNLIIPNDSNTSLDLLRSGQEPK